MPYDKIVEYYDDIFPLNPITLAFLQQSFTLGARVLDVGCGTGEYCLGLARAGFAVSGLDLDPQMIARAQAKARAAGLVAAFTVGNMGDLSRHYAPGVFAGLFCIGNSLVHASGHDELGDICRQFHALLGKGGRLVVQVINYDRVRKQQLKGLPTIENPARCLRFERHYELKDHEVLFTGVLQVDGVEERSVNRLYAAGADELRRGLLDAGFQELERFGSFAGSDFVPDASQPLILRCRK